MYFVGFTYLVTWVIAEPQTSVRKKSHVFLCPYAKGRNNSNSLGTGNNYKTSYVMKRIILLVTMVVFSLAVYSQRDATKFLGIPMDITKGEMIQKLEAFGFSYRANSDYLRGWFNDEQVDVYIRSQNNRITEIRVVELKLRTQSDVLSRFDQLVSQFEKNDNYAFQWRKQNNVIIHSSGYSFNYKDKKATFYQKDKTIKSLPDANKKVWIEIGKRNDISILPKPSYYIIFNYENLYNISYGYDL